MKKLAMMVAAALMVAGSMVGASLPAQAAPTPSVSVTITDGGGSYCQVGISVRGLEPNTHYMLQVLSSYPYNYLEDFTTNARGAYKSAGLVSVNREWLNKTNTLTFGVNLYNSGNPWIEARGHLANRCPAS